ncbi:NlpC/P60 family protein [Subsaximicrobium wynnwilliamsii]|uniref:NlpC/P60 family protein n=1 Tax=Subsaximicrobium wynnwilliamsii TaxID=291179 RepID=A0A5C6ZGZ2_9FLAO|nr:C40 family peptidase [Subsaximicrobium wynnwilliamsii]TXD83490.1 NlpC/P60 family protein [Subsaximicrobium wynnwilliamsii]TXD89235.1 NlpC/P60 family protein [Subsaximicrobium wynnwilliamsii]TXE03170.1 NlpC/P60 family protein [Subsaximicrobium wynnwilliamsii]
MRLFAFILLLCFCLSSCKSKSNVVTKKHRSTKTVANNRTSPSADTPKNIANIIDYAKTFEGTRYKYGGTTKRGMDCSGLIYTTFQKENIYMPRTTDGLSKEGDWVDVNDVKEGDLLFFATSKNSRSVNHVGIVTATRPGFVEFIHSSSSRGVMRSTLSERYWYLAYVQARRVL